MEKHKKALRQKAEEHIKAKLEPTASCRSDLETITLLHELEVHQIELAMQNEELLQSISDEKKAAEKYTELFDFAPSGYFVLSKTGEISNLNHMGANMLGKERSTLLNATFGLFISNETRPIFNQLLEKSFNSKVKESANVTFINKKDQPIYVQLSCIANQNDDDLCFVTAIDISDQITSVKELAKFRTISDQANYGASISALDGTFIYVNNAYENMLGWEANELLGKHFMSVHNHEQQSRIDEILALLKTDGGFTLIEINHSRKDGSTFPALMTAKVIKDENNIPLYMSSSLIDISERKQAQEAQNALIEAENATIAKNEFLSRMSHELRTPMNSILGYAQLLDTVELNNFQKRAVNQILNGGKHLLHLIDDVLNITKIESGKLPIYFEHIKVKELIDEMIDILQPIAFENQINLEQINSRNKQLLVVSDRQSLMQILLNLSNNAIKYNIPNGSVKVKVQLMPKNKEGNTYIRISITDTGIGISSDDIPKLFTAFERIGEERSNIQGTGLGLAVVKKLTEAVQGYLGVESVPGKGSTFWIEVPQAEGDIPIVQKPVLLKKANVNPTLNRGKVLYIEDNTPNIELVEQILLSHRPKIELLTSMYGYQAIEIALTQHPDLILLDLDLPDAHGSEIIKLLFNYEKTKRIPVVVVSADAMQMHIDYLLNLGAKHYLIKPIDVPAFLKIIDEYTN